jgi:nitrogen permease regulator 2-like protein
MAQPMDIELDQIHNILKEAFQTSSSTSCDFLKNTALNTNSTAATTTTQSDEESIFGSTCDYIITGNELAGEMIHVSTHNMHILARPSFLSNERYERNSLLFCVGFVLRRTEDPRPFRPVLNKWADTLVQLEQEDFFLTNHKADLLPTILYGLLLRLNSADAECNLVLQNDSALHFKLFRPPPPIFQERTRTTTNPVADHHVPVLLRKDWQVQLFDWDLAINWVVSNMDGISHARALSVKSEVDPEMVRACLRVLRHHNILALVDSFYFSNRYESTGKLLNEELCIQATEYVSKHRRGTEDSDKLMPWHDERGQQQQQQQREKSIKRLKSALPILYYSFNRNQSFADIWMDKLKTISKDDEGSVSQQRSSSRQAIDFVFWKRVLSSDMDPRRFVTFGIIHGLIQRIHCYPFAFYKQTSKVDTSVQTNTPKQKDYHLATQIASRMDGKTCDDALVCEFERPISELIDLARTVAHVSEIYST